MACCVGAVLVFILHDRIHLDKRKKWVQAIKVETKGSWKNESWQERHPPPAKSEGGNTKGASEV